MTRGYCLIYSPVRDEMALASRAVYCHMKIASSMGRSTREDSITDILLNELHTNLKSKFIVFQLSASEENRVGADWEWWITDGSIWLGALVQAKKLDIKSGKYKKLGYSSGTDCLQIDDLMCSSKLLNINAMYVFYNYSNKSKLYTKEACQLELIDHKICSCTIANAKDVKRLWEGRAFGFEKASGISMPICCQFCMAASHGIVQLFTTQNKHTVTESDTHLSTSYEDQIKFSKSPPNLVQHLLDAMDVNEDLLNSLKRERYRDLPGRIIPKRIVVTKLDILDRRLK